ncbi:hypothetical protein SEA_PAULODIABOLI_306 [Microbacterium phage PauloDiaboli]|nr:hypothetical protein SEA_PAULODIABOLI_306 [Microbacterium phage PauloDiaboli]QWY84113.1 hypothetical protein SEA_A3WALLY_306 [Microbacterium phage A3Wally]
MLPVMGAYWITLAFPLIYIFVWWINDGDLMPTRRGDHYARIAMYICVGIVLIGALVGIWMSALVPGLYG